MAKEKVKLSYNTEALHGEESTVAERIGSAVLIAIIFAAAVGAAVLGYKALVAFPTLVETLSSI